MKASDQKDPAEVMTPSWELVSKSFKLVQQNIEQIIFLFLLPALTYTLGFILLDTTKGLHHLTTRQTIGLIIVIIGCVWSLINLAPSLYFRVRTLTQKQPVSTKQAYKEGLPLFFRILATQIAVGILVLVGFVLLIVPGVIALRRYYLASYYLVDKNLSISEALKMSSEQTKPYRGYVWGTLGVQLVFAIGGSVLAPIPVVGIVLGSLVGYICLFLDSLRYRELVKANA